MATVKLVSLLIVSMATVATSQQKGDGYESLEYNSPADAPNWWLNCNASITQNGSIRLVPSDGQSNKAGTIVSKAVWPSHLVNFEFEVRIKARVLGGYAIYITPNSSVAWSGCCYSPLAPCAASHLGVLYKPGLVFAFRLSTSRYGTAVMFPNTTKINYPGSSVSAFFDSIGFAWPELFETTLPKYFIGNCPTSMPNSATTSVRIRLKDGNITIVMATLNGDVYGKNWTCANNAPVPGLISLIERGDAVLAISGGYNRPVDNADPVIEYVRFHKNMTTTTTSKETTANSASTAASASTASRSSTQHRSTASTSSATTAAVTRSTSLSEISQSSIEPIEPSTGLAISATTDTDKTSTAREATTPSRKIPTAPPLAESNQVAKASPSQKMMQISVGYYEDVAASAMTAASLLEECNDFEPTRAALPPSQTGSVTLVNVSFAADSLVELSTVSETISVSGMILLSWSVTTCPANSSDMFTKRVPQRIYVAQVSDVFTPAFLFKSASSVVYMQRTSLFDEDMIVTIGKPDGSPNRTINFYWLKAGTFVSSCQLDLAKFPFDEQTCTFLFSMVRSTNLTKFRQPLFVWPEDDYENEEWHFVTSSSPISEMSYGRIPTSGVRFIATLRRNPWYYIINLILPTAALTILHILSFLIPGDGSDRLSFSVTILLSITVAKSSVNSYIPTSSQSILLADYISSLIWLCVGITLCQMITWLTYATLQGNRKPTKAARIMNGIFFALSAGAFIGINVYSYTVLVKVK